MLFNFYLISDETFVTGVFELLLDHLFMMDFSISLPGILLQRYSFREKLGLS